MKTIYFKQVADLYKRVSDLKISTLEFDITLHKISIESGISEEELREQGYFYSFKN